MDCTPDALVSAAKCFDCLTPQERGAAELYLLTLIAEVDQPVDMEELMKHAKCFMCLPPNVQEAAKNYLLCAIVNHLTPT